MCKKKNAAAADGKREEKFRIYDVRAEREKYKKRETFYATGQ